jgi:hypothetical protein
MARFIVERTFPNGLQVPMTDEGAKGCLQIVAVNGEQDVTWVNSYVSLDKTKTYCVYDAPSPEAIRQSARRNNLPVETITQVTVLDPYFYH